jgi:ribonucleoside-triphosphate reductase
MEMQVQKRNGETQSFDINKMAKAIYNARLDANEEKTIDECVEEARQVLETLPYGERVLNIEEIQDAIEQNFVNQGYLGSLKQFTIYREDRARDRKNP